MSICLDGRHAKDKMCWKPPMRINPPSRRARRAGWASNHNKILRREAGLDALPQLPGKGGIFPWVLLLTL